MDKVDCIVAGAGVVGLAIARALALGGREVLVLESAADIGTGASSRNSEVIHAGIHYPPGSLKARLCVEGRELLYDYCAARGIDHRRLGKLVVAADQAEVGRLEKLRAQAIDCGVDDLAWLSPGQVLGLEPELGCVRALLSPSTGVLDSGAYLLALQADLESAGGRVVLRTAVERVGRRHDGFDVVTGDLSIACRVFVNAAGLAAPALARSIEGLEPARLPQARFARGHYFALQGRSPFRRLVYPVAEKTGLGIHVTLDLAGSARFGPDVEWIDAVDYRFDESRKAQFVRAIRRYYPALDPDRLLPAYTGVRARIYGPDDPPADFRIDGPAGHGVAGLVNLFGIESPGLTASLAIGRQVAALLDG